MLGRISPWRVDILDDLEQSALRKQVDLKQRPLAETNLSAIQTRLPVFQCPATPESPRVVDSLGFSDPALALSAGACDYAAVFEVFPEPEVDPFPGTWSNDRQLAGDQQAPPGSEITPDADALLARTMPVPLKTIRDGLSQTVLLIEQAGKPNHYVGRVEAMPVTPSEGAWATGEMASIVVAGINRDNLLGLYGFHSGANVAMCDGSARMIATHAEWGVVSALLTRSGDEIIADDDWR